MIAQESERDLKTVIDQQSWLDRIGDPLQSGVRSLYEGAGVVGQKIQNILNGTWLGHPLHPVITDVTVGALTAAVVLDGLDMASNDERFAPGADAALVVGVTSAVGAAAAGITDWQFTEGEARRFGVLHALLNTTALGLYITSLALRKGGQRDLGRGLALTGFLLSGAAAYLGGDLVYRQKIGVNHAPKQALPEDFTPVIAAANVPEGTLVRARLKEKNILLVRRGHQVFAINETCAHMGGPLADGNLCDDNSVICPWHGSRFDLETGLVINGPSAYPQPRYEARERDGMIEVRQPPEVNG